MTHNIGVYKTIEEATGGLEVAGSGGQAVSKVDMAEEAITNHNGGVEGMGYFCGSGHASVGLCRQCCQRSIRVRERIRKHKIRP
jgi:hypothetical protein